jgi:hypothetical protein
MHDGCAGQFENGRQVVDKVRMMGFAAQPMPMPLQVHCVACHVTFEMAHFEDRCPECDMVYGVTPCHAFDPASVMAAGIGY